MLQIEERPSAGADESGNAVVLVLRGELDFASAPDLRGVIGRACHGEGSNLVIDLTGLAFIDSSGIAALVHAYKLTAASGGSLVLRSPGSRLLRQLEITGLGSLFTIEN